MSKKKFYLTLDTETATLPFVNSLCKNAKQKQKIAIAKPLVYDIGWVISDREGNIVKTENFLIQETFFVPNIFNTAYYCNKRPVYMNLLSKGEIKVALWNDVIKILISDLQKCNLAVAYNACFDFKKAIPFTEQYIKYLYSNDYNQWEKKQYKKSLEILAGLDKSQNPEYLLPYFELRNECFPIADLWGIACERLININKYRNYCLQKNLLTTSALYFKTSAENSFQYLMRQHDFSEDHTALSDALIEMKILTKALKKGKINSEIKAFPFRELGTTYNYVSEHPKYKKVVENALKEYITINDGYTIAKEEIGSVGRYWKKIINIYEEL